MIKRDEFKTSWHFYSSKIATLFIETKPRCYRFLFVFSRFLPPRFISLDQFPENKRRSRRPLQGETCYIHEISAIVILLAVFRGTIPGQVALVLLRKRVLVALDLQAGLPGRSVGESPTSQLFLISWARHL